jgi:tRNA(fMet)-specific endonuclease VapC
VLRRFLLKNGVRVLFADEQTTYHYASVFRQLRKQGTPIPTNDMWIAALVLQHSLVLHARDGHCGHLPQLILISGRLTPCAAPRSDRRQTPGAPG